MNRLYEVTDTMLIWQTIGCLIGLCVSVLLAMAVRSSWNFELQRQPGIALSVALFVWNLDGLANGLLIIAGYGYQSIPAKMACAAGYSGLCFLTWSVLGVWVLHTDGRSRRWVQPVLRILALITGLVLTVWLWVDAAGGTAPLSRTGIRIAAEAVFFVLVLAGIAVCISSASPQPSKLIRICAAVTMFGVIGPLAGLAQIPVFDSLPRSLRAGVSA